MAPAAPICQRAYEQQETDNWSSGVHFFLTWALTQCLLAVSSLSLREITQPMWGLAILLPQVFTEMRTETRELEEVSPEREVEKSPHIHRKRPVMMNH